MDAVRSVARSGRPRTPASRVDRPPGVAQLGVLAHLRDVRSDVRGGVRAIRTLASSTPGPSDSHRCWLRESSAPSASGGLVGRIVTGPLSDHIDRRRAVMLALAVETLSFVGIAVSDGLVLLYASSIAFGLSYGGSVAVFPALVADYFGRTHAGAIVGTFLRHSGVVRGSWSVCGAAAFSEPPAATAGPFPSRQWRMPARWAWRSRSHDRYCCPRSRADRSRLGERLPRVLCADLPPVAAFLRRVWVVGAGWHRQEHERPRSAGRKSG